jgi:hypothetical protein
VLTISTTLVHVRLHVNIAVLGTQVGLGREKELDVLLGGFENSRQSRHGETRSAKADSGVVDEYCDLMVYC